MRHLKAGRKFGRTTAHRKALFRNMVTALLERERIRTTLPKAKELRSKVEKTITLGKKGTLHARRMAFRTVSDKAVVQKLFGPLAERYAKRNGGYTRIIRLGNRMGDDAPMAFIELVGEDEPAVKETKPKAKAKAKPKKESEAAPKQAKTAKKKETEAKAAKPKKAASKKAETKETQKADAKPKKAAAPKKADKEEK